MKSAALCLLVALELCAASAPFARRTLLLAASLMQINSLVSTPGAATSLYPLVNTSRPLGNSSPYSASSFTLDLNTTLATTPVSTNGSAVSTLWAAPSSPSLNRTFQFQQPVVPTSVRSFPKQANFTLTNPPWPVNTSRPSSGRVLTVTIDCTDASNYDECSLVPPANMTNMLSLETDDCTNLADSSRPMTSFSVVYTSTVTFWGHRSDYTPPYATMTLPRFCMRFMAEAFDDDFYGMPPVKAFSKIMVPPFSHEAADYTAEQPRPTLTFVTTDKNPSVVFPTEPVPQYSPTWDTPGDKDGGAHKPALSGSYDAKTPSGERAGDSPGKANSIKGGREGKEDGKQKEQQQGQQQGKQDTKQDAIQDTKPARPGSVPGGSFKAAPETGGVSPYPQPSYTMAPGPGSGLGGGPSAAQETDRAGVHPQPDYVVTARASQVVINGQTYSNLGFGQTSVVHLGGEGFTIYPNSVVGQGGTLKKPAPAPTGVWVWGSTSAVVGGVAVILTDSKAVIGSSTMDVPERGMSTTIHGHAVAVGPGSVVVGHETLTFQPHFPWRETHVVVRDAQLVTARGRSVVVVHSTTFTYGPAIAATTRVVGSDTVSIGPSGVSVHGRLLGGRSVGLRDLDFEAVGGTPITEIGSSLAVIDGKTLTVGPGSHQTTTVIAGNTYTAGPGGITASGWTLGYPFGDQVVSTFYASRTRHRHHAAAAVETGLDKGHGMLDGGSGGDSGDNAGANDEDAGNDSGGDTVDENHKVKGAAVSLHRSMRIVWTAVCIATGVWVFLLV